MKVTIIMVAPQYAELRRRLFPLGDTDEQFGCGVAGVSGYPGGYNLLLRLFVPADKSCLVRQSAASIRPDPRFVEYVWTLAEKSGSSLIDFHTHPFCESYVRFSPIDDRDAKNGFPKMVERLGTGPHASVVLGRQSLDAQWYDARARVIRPVAEVRILGENLRTIVPTSADAPAGRKIINR
jgi:hypothetical protein